MDRKALGFASFEDAENGIMVKLISKPDLIRRKIAAKRPKDLAAVAELKRIN